MVESRGSARSVSMKWDDAPTMAMRRRCLSDAETAAASAAVLTEPAPVVDGSVAIPAAELEALSKA